MPKCEIVLSSDEHMTADELTDLIAAFVDELDELDLGPDVSTVGTGTRVVMTVEVDPTTLLVRTLSGIGATVEEARGDTGLCYFGSDDAFLAELDRTD